MLQRTKKPKRVHQGRKSGCTDEFIKLTRQLIGKLGATNKHLAEYFGVDVSTIEYWARTRPDFKHAQKTARLEYGLKVAKALSMAAVGFTMPEKKITYTVMGGVKIIKEITESTRYYPPNVAAAEKYLSIMFRDIWATPETVHHLHSGTINHEHNIRKIEEIPMDELNAAEQDLMLSLCAKQINTPHS